MDNSFASELVHVMGRDLRRRLPPPMPSLHVKLYVERLWLAELVRAETLAADCDRGGDALPTGLASAPQPLSSAA